MAKTNYDVMLENMTVDKMTDLIKDSTETNTCVNCAYWHEEEKCPDFACSLGIKLWLLKEAGEK